MTREQVTTIFTDLGLEAPQKGVVNALLNAFNQEKSNEIDAVKKTAEETVEAKYKGFVKPEDHQKIVDELNQEKGKAALNDRKAKYKAKNLNIDDEDILTLIDGKLKDSKDFDKDLEEYVKAHPGFVKVAQPTPPQPKPETKPFTIGGTGSGPENKGLQLNLGEAIAEHYKK